jgi:serine/threonine protein phosphatase PrpC
VSPSGHDPEPRLPAQVVIDCRWYGSFFHGRCGRGNHGGPELTVRGVTVRGGVHAVTETEGQDVTGAAWQARTGTLFVAVADGLGSLPRSARMAREAVRAALHLCMTKPDDLAFEAAGHRFFGAVAAGLRRSLGAEAADDGGTTLLVAEVVADERGARVTVHGVGDSEAWALDGQGWHPMHHERDGVGTDGGNVTRDLPTDPRPRTQRYRLPPGAVLVLATDGFAENLQPGGSAWSHHLAARWYGPPRPVDFVRLVTAVGGELSDDRGVVAVWIGR